MGVSIWQLLIVLVILLLVFGPARIEGLGKSLGKSVKGFKKGMDDTDDKTKKISGKPISKDEEASQHS